MSCSKRKGLYANGVSSGVWCSAWNCRNSRRACPDLSFYRFPKEKERCAKWVENSGRQDLRSKSPEHLWKNCRLCANHFEKRYIHYGSRLAWNAVPTVFKSQDRGGTRKSSRRQKLGPTDDEQGTGVDADTDELAIRRCTVKIIPIEENVVITPNVDPPIVDGSVKGKTVLDKSVDLRTADAGTLKPYTVSTAATRGVNAPVVVPRVQTPTIGTSVDTPVVDTAMVKTSTVNTSLNSRFITLIVNIPGVMERRTVDTPVNTPAVGKPVLKTPTVDGAVCAEATPIVDTPVVETSTVGSSVDTPAVVRPVVGTPAVEAPAVDLPQDSPAVVTPVVDTPVVKMPTVYTPAVVTPIVDTPVVEAPSVGTPEDTSAVVTPIFDTLVGKTPVNKLALVMPTVDKPVVEAPTVDTPSAVLTPVVDTPVAKKPSVDTPAVEQEAPTMGTSLDSPAVVTPIVGTPVVKAPTVDLSVDTPLSACAGTVDMINVDQVVVDSSTESHVNCRPSEESEETSCSSENLLSDDSRESADRASTCSDGDCWMNEVSSCGKTISSSASLANVGALQARVRRLEDQLAHKNERLTTARLHLFHLQSKVSVLENKLQRMKRTKRRLSMHSLIKGAGKHLEGPALNFFATQLKMFKRGGKGRKWSVEDYELAAALHQLSRKAYRFCRKIFALPTQESLRMWHKKGKQGQNDCGKSTIDGASLSGIAVIQSDHAYTVPHILYKHNSPRAKTYQESKAT